jgi:hypothetical protein
MALKYTTEPYGGTTKQDDWRSRFPANARPIATAPEQSARPVLIYEPDGKSHWCLHHRGQWQKLQPFRDGRDGSVAWRMNGEQVAQPVAWASS